MGSDAQGVPDQGGDDIIAAVTRDGFNRTVFPSLLSIYSRVRTDMVGWRNVSADLSKSLDLYATLAKRIPMFDERSEVENMLILREAICEALLAGQKLSEAQKKVLAKADDQLVEQAAWITEHFPQLFEHGRRIPRDRWWHLDKGPQVREEAERAA